LNYCYNHTKVEGEKIYAFWFINEKLITEKDAAKEMKNKKYQNLKN
jgi:hypothetical protein